MGVQNDFKQTNQRNGETDFRVLAIRAVR